MSVPAALRFAALGAFALACGAGEAASTGSERAAIVGGVPSGDEDDAVVRVVAHEPTPYDTTSCSGVLLAPNVMVTSLHCVAVFDLRAPFSCRADGTVDPKWSGGWIGETLDPATLDVVFGAQPSVTPAAHGAQIFGSGSTSVCLDDIAFVVLDTALPSPGMAVRTERPVVTGELMTLIGFGQNDLDGVARARRSGVPVLSVGPDSASDLATTAAPRTFTVGDGPCGGDSGSPALSDETGAVTGVMVAIFDGNCTQPGTRSWFTRLAPFSRLLRDAFAAAGADPVEEATPRATPPRAGSCALAPSATPWAAASAFLALVVALHARRRRP